MLRSARPPFFQISNPPPRSPPALPLNPLQDIDDDRSLLGALKDLAGEPQWLQAIRPAPVVAIRPRYPDDPPRVPEDRSGFRADGRARGFMLKEQEGCGMVHLVPGYGGRVAEEDGGEGRGGGGEDGVHLAGAEAVPVVDEVPEGLPPFGEVPPGGGIGGCGADGVEADSGDEVHDVRQQEDCLVRVGSKVRRAPEEVYRGAEVPFRCPGLDGDQRLAARYYPPAYIHAREAPEDGLLHAAGEAVYPDGLEQRRAPVQVPLPRLWRAAEHLEDAEDHARRDHGRAARRELRQEEVYCALVEGEAEGSSGVLRSFAFHLAGGDGHDGVL